MVNKEIEVDVQGLGHFKIRRPKAGVMNDALIKAESETGFKKVLFFTELLPACIIEHPFGTTKVKEALRNIEIEQQEVLIKSLSSLVEIKDGDVEKKSEVQSE